MKTVRTILAAALVIAVLVPARAGSSTRHSMKYVINLFIDAFAHGQFEEFDDILSKNSTMTISRANNVKAYNRYEIIRMLEPFKNVEQNCVTTASMLEDVPGQVMVKVNMKYRTFTRINYISMSLGKNGWSITNISSLFTES